jgi:hypothetical protein
MEFLWMKYKFSDAIGMSIITMNLDLQSRFDSSVSHLQTLGGNVFYNKGKVNAMGTGYYQTGRNQPKNLSTVKTSAWMAAVKADYSFNKNFSLGIGSDYLSGRDMNSKSSNISYFNPLYGTGHKFYGSMDYFYVSSAHNNVGLWDSYVNVNLNSSEKLNWQIVLHHFESAANVINYSGGKASSSLGNEADISFNYKIMDGAKLSGGYSQMFTDPSMKYVKRILPNQEMKSIQNWVWLSININPDVLIYKFKSK